ncbi:TfuA-like protein [Hyalangium rubrum]|uniref:TfuA-like protein n=1 Tax=Hyalangium rubrum TaxID=3103134 RepID=A0ABU5HBF0_9BACT|nr:TfuA-like protein [Hyalangium sp. s54d21]MDY7230452.1 TfuA-like protein [Hyalangium sp. s54d21]
MASVIVFLGPSLSQERARAILDAEYRPPARKGDIYRVLASGVKTIVLIDGIFHSGPSIWQRELLAALDEGIEVFGASSMGALRAAELHSFGMVGYGTIFEWYRDGLINADDEVALRHAPEDMGYRALSEPLVNIRYTLRQAVADGKLSEDESERLLTFMRETYYPERSYRRLLECPLLRDWPKPRVAEWKQYLRENAVDLKSRDASGVLRHCAQRERVGRSGSSDRVDLWREEFQRVSLGFRQLGSGTTPVAGHTLFRAARQSQELWDATSQRVLRQWFILDWARQRELTCPETSVRAFESHWARANDVVDAGTWARAHGLTRQEHTALLAERALLSWLLESGPGAFGLEWDRDAVARLEAHLSRERPPRTSEAEERAFIVAWARESGVRCPPAERDALFASWGLGSATSQVDAARSLELAPERLLRVLEERALAEWVIAQGPTRFGRAHDLEVAVVQELQLSGRTASLLTPGQPS